MTPGLFVACCWETRVLGRLEEAGGDGWPGWKLALECALRAKPRAGSGAMAAGHPVPPQPPATRGQGKPFHEGLSL